MATSDDGGDGAYFVTPTKLEFKLLDQSAEAATGTFSGYRLLALGFKSLATPRDAGAAGALDALLTEIRSARSAVAR